MAAHVKALEAIKLGRGLRADRVKEWKDRQAISGGLPGIDHPNTRGRAMRDAKTIATTPRKAMAPNAEGMTCMSPDYVRAKSVREPQVTAVLAVPRLTEVA